MLGSVLLLLLAVDVYGQCGPLTSDPPVSNPGISLPDPSGLPDAHPAGCSEIVDVLTMGPGELNPPWPRVDCPHLRGDLTNFEDVYPSVVADMEITITGKVLLRSCSIADPSVIIRRINVADGGELVIDDSDITLNVREITVNAGGAFLAGSDTCRRYGRLDITLHGTRADSTTSIWVPTPSKGFLSRGTVDLFGKKYHPTWTRLARGASAGTDILYLQDPVNWEVGQQLLVTPTVTYDCPAQWGDYCKKCFSWQTCDPEPHQNEVVTIVALEMDPTTSEYAVQISPALTNLHWAGKEYQAEVALLSRRININGVDSGDDFGGHTHMSGLAARARFAGVATNNLGQLNIEARYPFHFHMMGTNASHSYVEESVVTNSNFRCYVVHGTNRTRLSRNIAYNAKGMCYYLEDGVEEENLLEYNLGAHIHPIKKPAQGASQGGEVFVQAADLFNPADSSASAFYIPNAYNDFIGNVASGGWSGFAFPNVPRPLGLHKDEDWLNNNPLHRPLKSFRGNYAHSTGFYWTATGSAYYVGAWLTHEGDGSMRYDSGRNERSTMSSDGSRVWMLFQDNKAALTTLAFGHWGNQVIVERFEGHDITLGAMLFGEAVIDDALFVARTSNQLGWEQLELSQYNQKQGFQFYDTWVKTILNNVIFRGYKAAPGDYAVSYMSHSDHYTPQGINSVRGLVFQDTDESVIVRLGNCGETLCPGDGPSTMSSRMYSVWDWDGSYSRTGVPTIMGSNLQWWNLGAEYGCAYNSDWTVYHCPWRENLQVAYLSPYISGLTDGCDGSVSGTCTDQYADYTVGAMNLWGKPTTHSIALGPWAGVTGYANTGWHWSVDSPAHSISGSPSSFSIGDEGTQLERGHFVVVSITYPAATTFRVYTEATWWGTTHPDLAMSTKTAVLSNTETIYDTISEADCSGSWNQMCTDTGGVGPAWHFDGTHLFIRMVNLYCHSNNGFDDCASGNAHFEHDGIRVWDIMGGFRLNVVATCSGCAADSWAGVDYYTLSSDPIPPAFNNNFGAVRTDTGGPVGSTTYHACPAPGAAVPTCSDGLRNQDETAVDCGGATCPACAPAPTCSDGIRNQDEEAVDCGGTICAACPSCSDGIQNGDETGLDCGGAICAACASCSDGIQNGDETGLDCGGAVCAACASCSDGIQNGDETGLDCGGSSCSACGPPPSCFDDVMNQDEEDVDCGGSICIACPTCSDNIRNQGENDVDCGGPCTACETCVDGIQNQGEAAVDCGGPCRDCECPAIPGSAEVSSTCEEPTSSTCTLACTAITRITSVKTCSTVGTWDSTGAPVCEADACSGIPSGAGHTSTCVAGASSGQSCTLACGAGYTGDEVVRACADGAWDSVEPPACTEAACAPFPSSGDFTSACSSTTTSSGDTCQLTCTEFGTSARRTCTRGTWDSTEGPVCEANACPGLSARLPMTSTCSSGGAAGGTCVISCDPTTHSGTPVTISCVDGSWNIMAADPGCVPRTDCDSFENGPNGLPCENEGVCDDGEPNDFSFTCTCSGASGENCETAHQRCGAVTCEGTSTRIADVEALKCAGVTCRQDECCVPAAPPVVLEASSANVVALLSPLLCALVLFICS